MNIIETAPIIRGYTYNGKSSSIVHYVEHFDEPEVSCKIEDLKKLIKPTTKSVCIEGVGSFLIGNDYDEAKTQTSKSPSLIGSEAIVHNKVVIVTGGAQGFGEELLKDYVKKELLFLSQI